MRISLEDLKIDADKVERDIKAFIKERVDSAGVKGGVLGISGGVDSSTTAVLATKALGSERVVALIMPDPRTTPKEDIKDAVEVARMLKVKYYVIDISKAYDAIASSLPLYDSRNLKANGNIRARLRMVMLYYYANVLNYLVIGTGDRSELLIGYFTKYGDGGVDILPIGCLYKTQVRQLALHLGLPRRISLKPSSPRLWPGHEAEKELGMSYEEIDVILHGLVDLRMNPEEVAKASGIALKKVLMVKRMMENSKHKRETPPIPRIRGLNA